MTKAMFGNKPRDRAEIYETLAMVPLRDVVIFPYMMMPFVIGRSSSVRALEYSLAHDRRIFLAAQHDATTDDPKASDIYTVGTISNIVWKNASVLNEGLDLKLATFVISFIFTVVVSLITRPRQRTA